MLCNKKDIHTIYILYTMYTSDGTGGGLEGLLIKKRKNKNRGTEEKKKREKNRNEVKKGK